jgi:5-formyltetrahydrofolate cyclo-ligase
LPVLSKTKEKPLEFVLYRLGDKMRLNRYNILEPVDAQGISTEELDLVILPLVGFDERGNRLGMGGGYYDATFSFLLNRNRSKPFMLGLGYEDQRVDELPTDSWDIQLNGILTERRLITLRPDEG